MKRVKKFWEENKMFVLECYAICITVFFVILAGYTYILSIMTSDLVSTVQIREAEVDARDQELGSLTFDINYQTAMFKDLDRQLNECKEKLKKYEDGE